METTTELFYKIVPLVKIFLSPEKGKGNTGIGESVLLWLAGRWGWVCLTFLWEDLISFAVKEEKCSSFEKDTLFDKHGSGDGRPCVKKWGEDFFMIGIQKDGFTRDSAGLPPKLPDSACGAGTSAVVYAVTQVKPADLMILCFWVIILPQQWELQPAVPLYLPRGIHSPFWRWCFGGGGGSVFFLRFTFCGGGFVLASKRR